MPLGGVVRWGRTLRAAARRRAGRRAGGDRMACSFGSRPRASRSPRLEQPAGPAITRVETSCPLVCSLLGRASLLRVMRAGEADGQKVDHYTAVMNYPTGAPEDPRTLKRQVCEEEVPLNPSPSSFLGPRCQRCPMPVNDVPGPRYVPSMAGSPFPLGQRSDRGSIMDGRFPMGRRHGPAPSWTVRSPWDSDMASATGWTAMHGSRKEEDNSTPLMLRKKAIMCCTVAAAGR